MTAAAPPAAGPGAGGPGAGGPDAAGLAELHDELRAVARDLLGKAGVRAEPDWAVLTAAGWPGLEVPEAAGGAGATFAEVAVLLEEMGRAAAAGPFLGTAVLGVGALALLAPGPERDALLSGVAAGDVRLAVAAGTGDDALDGTPPFRLARTPGGLRLSGAADFVPDAEAADHLLLPALDPDGTPVVVHLAPGDQRPAITPRPVLDATRRLAWVDAGAEHPDEGLAVADGAVRRFAGDPGTAARRVVERGALAVAVDAVGVAAVMLDATVAYAGARHQFGRPIGSFQAVKHACADMLVRLTVARELVGEAVAAVAAGQPDAGVAVSMATAYAGDMAVEVVGTALQLHGGIGYTWESGVHASLKRAALDRALFGSPAAHRRRLAARYPTP